MFPLIVVPFVVFFVAVRHYSLTPAITPRRWPRRRRVRHVSPTAQDVVFFTDGSNFDDLLTLLYIAKAPQLRLRAVYIGANAWASGTSSRRIFRDMLHMLSDDFARVPVLLGSFYALDDESAARKAGRPGAVVAHYRAPVPAGGDGIAACDDAFGTARMLPPAPPGADAGAPSTDAASLAALAAELRSLPESSVLFLATGTLTPLAKLLTQPGFAGPAADIVPRIARVVFMGGAVHVPGNLFSVPWNNRAEFNVYNDPHAAHAVLAALAARGTPATLVPLDATAHAPITPALCAQLFDTPRTPEAQLAGLLLRNMRAIWGSKFFREAFLWDVSAAVVATHADVVREARTMRLRVITEEGPDGEHQGWTKPCDEDKDDGADGYDVNAVLNIDGELVQRHLLRALQDRTNSSQRALRFS